MIKIILILLVVFLFSCGGVVGHIKMEAFNCDTLIFQNCINQLFKENILLKPDSISIYKDEEQSKIALVVQEKDTFAFAYEIASAVNRKSLPMLIITNFGENGEVLEFDKNLSRQQKEIMEDIYAHKILPHLGQCSCLPLNE